MHLTLTTSSFASSMTACAYLRKTGPPKSYAGSILLQGHGRKCLKLSCFLYSNQTLQFLLFSAFPMFEQPTKIGYENIICQGVYDFTRHHILGFHLFFIPWQWVLLCLKGTMSIMSTQLNFRMLRHVRLLALMVFLHLICAGSSNDLLGIEAANIISLAPNDTFNLLFHIQANPPHE